MAVVFVGIGSSINRLENIQQGVLSLRNEFGELQLSPLYESEAVGFDGVNFYNLVVSFCSELDVMALRDKLKRIEKKHGRPEKTIKYSPRTLDLDLLIYDQKIDASIDLPRAEITENAFVLKPLSELAPQLTHPVLGMTYQALWTNYPKEKQKLWTVHAEL